MSSFLTVVIIFSAILIVITVIMQPSKDGGLGGLASGGVTDSVFGTNRNEFLAKTTWGLMAVFLVSSLVLAKYKTAEHNEKEKAINTRSKIEEVTNKEKDLSLQKAENDVDDVLKETTKDLKKTDVAPITIVEPKAQDKVDKTVDDSKKDNSKSDVKTEGTQPQPSE